MAKNKGLPGLRKALNTVDTLGKQMNRERMADYKVGLSASAAGTANLRAQTGAFGRDAIANSGRQTTSLRKLAQQGKAAKKKVASQQESAVNRYGSALSASIGNSFGIARANAAGAAANAKAASAAGAQGAKTTKTVVGIAQMGVQAQQAAAKYSMNQALQQRTIIDNQTLAGLTEDLYKQSLAYNQQQALYEQQRKDAARDAKAAASAQTEATTDWLTVGAPQIGTWAQQAIESGDYIGEDGKLDIAKMSGAYATEMGISAETDPFFQQKMGLITTAAGFMRTGSDVTTAMNQAADQLYGGMAGWDKIQPSVMGSLASGINAGVEAAALTNLQTLTGVTYGGGAGTGVDIGGFLSHAAGIGPAGVEHATTEGRDAAAAAIREQFGASTARAWLRGQTNWSDDAINAYLGALPADVAGELQFATAAAPATPSTPGAPPVTVWAPGGSTTP